VPELSNAAIADALEELGDLYELDGAIVHRVRAYRAAAKVVRECSVSVAALAREGRAVELPRIGNTLQEKILTLVQTGTIPAAERLRAQFPPETIAAGRTRRPAAPRIVLPRAIEIGEALVAGLMALAGDGAHIELAGSIRRQADSVKDIDVIATTTRPTTLAKSLAKLEQIERVSSAGKAGARARTHSGVGVDLRIAAPAQLGSLLQHFTGSGAHNAALREAAVRRSLHVSEYGILDASSSEMDATGATDTYATEREVYERLGLAYVEPELRENRGELEAARAGELPRLIELQDIRGDLHSHTIASDGHNTIEEMALAARERGYEYLAITDHSASHGFGNAVSPEQLRRQIELVREADERLEAIELLAGSEVNILPDGSLDYDDELLGELDWVVASVHTSFGMREQAMTERMIAAIEHPLVDAIGHPTGRLIERRAPYAIDLDTVFAAAARTGTLLEINANPDRRDLSDVHARAAARAGATIVIDSDAHRTRTLANMRWGVATARRAWLTREQVANTRPWPQLEQRRERRAKR
jgi:DNA polymerase (family 10)